MPTLYFSPNLNPRLCVATARHLAAPVRYEAAAPLAPDAPADFARLNPNRRVPVLVRDDGSSLWETDAIACELARLAGRPDFFPEGPRLPELLRWLSWTAMHWGQACSGLYYQRLIAPRYGLPLLTEGEMVHHESEFQRLAAILEAHLAQHRWMLGDTLTYADFRVGALFPYAEAVRLDLSAHPGMARLAAQLDALPAWHDPFAGL